jgi:hypothetical protein
MDAHLAHMMLLRLLYCKQARLAWLPRRCRGCGDWPHLQDCSWGVREQRHTVLVLAASRQRHANDKERDWELPLLNCLECIRAGLLQVLY